MDASEIADLNVLVPHCAQSAIRPSSLETIDFSEHSRAVSKHDFAAEHSEHSEYGVQPCARRTVLDGRDGRLPQDARFRQRGLRHAPLPPEGPNRLAEGAWTRRDGIHDCSREIRQSVLCVDIR